MILHTIKFFKSLIKEVQVMRFLRFLMLGGAVLGFLATPAQAQIERYSFDKAHTQILFFVDHLGFSFSQGEFHDYDGGFVFDRTQPENSSVNVTINTASIDMDHEKWDQHMKSADFFDIDNFPTAEFKSTNIEVTGDKTARITGDLTMLGKTNPVTLDVTYNKSGTHPFNGEFVSGFSASATIDRTQWGMDYGVPNVGKNVELRLEVEGFREDSSAETERTAN